MSGRSGCRRRSRETWLEIRLVPVELGVEGDGGGFEVQFADEGGAFGGSVFAVHAAVFPFNAEGAVVMDVVEGGDNFFKIDAAATDAAEIPEAAGVAEGGVSAEDADGAVALVEPDVFHVNVEDAGGESVEKFDVIDALVCEMGGVEIEAEAGVIFDGCQGAVGGGDVEGDFAGVDFEGEVDVLF